MCSLGLSVEEKLLDDICQSFDNDAWVPAPDGWWLGEHKHERLIGLWDRFKALIKQESRYFFSKSRHDDLDWPHDDNPEQILEAVGSFINQHSLWRELEQQEMLFRARRVADGQKLNDFADLCPPPPEKAVAGRMNPSGISYGYFSLDRVTALLEVAVAPPSSYVLASFALKAPMLVVDLTRLPSLPSIFDIDRHDERANILFLQSFIRTISASVPKDGGEDVEYVPTQIVSEYIAQVLRIRSNECPQALLYKSAVDSGKVNVVLFPVKRSGMEWVDLLSLKGVVNHSVVDWPACAALVRRESSI